MQHIAEVAQKNKFNLVFTVSDKVVPQYQVLSDIIGHNSRVASLKVNDDTIAELIDEVYRNISNHIELSVEHKPDYAKVEILTNCGEEGKGLRPTASCHFFGKAHITFHVRVTVVSCDLESDQDSNVIRIGTYEKLGRFSSIYIFINPFAPYCAIRCPTHSISDIRLIFY